MTFARQLAAHGDRVALITPSGELSYRELAQRVTATAKRLGPVRRLVLLAGANRVDALVVHLAALSAGHPVLLVPGDGDGTIGALTEAYDPDVVARQDERGHWSLDERRHGTAHTLHPDLALLLSTSGSTGSPKLVRLSHDNVQSNASSIAVYLGITDTDRAATTLPPHYCYGLSVIHSHLLRGAGLILTDRSVADAGFWEEFRAARGTSLAGVPYTFDLLDRVGFTDMELPHLRRVTQAGGRLAPERVARYAEQGRRAGWELFVMYGQTEATARMAYLPPHLAAARPEAVGVAIPGGSFRLAPVDPAEPGTDPSPDAAGVGELVYSGPNVMLGYAQSPADLALGRTVQELYTGDLARRAPDGLYEIVGRRSRFAKICGLRIDPQRVEALLERHGITASCAGDGDALAVAALTDGAGGRSDETHVRRLVAHECGIPPRAVRVRLVAELPRLASGKSDYEAVRRLTRPRPTAADPAGADPAAAPGGAETGALLRSLYAEILDRDDVTDDSSFVGLGGDSLCYVEMSLRLEEALGTLPTDWPARPIRELTSLAPQSRERPKETQARADGAEGTPTGPPPRAGRTRPTYPAARETRSRGARRSLETGIALRAVGIVLVVGSHIPVFTLQGSAHILIGVAGYNFARFHLTAAAHRDRLRHLWRGVARIALPSIVWISCAVLLTGLYDPANALLLNSLLDQGTERHEWHYWFVEALVYFLVVLGTLLAVPLLDRLERRHPFGVPLTLVAIGLVGRYDLLGVAPARFHLGPAVVFWLFALGWAAARATSARQRLLLTAVLLLTTPGLFEDQPQRTLLVVAGLTLLIWVPTLPSLGPLNRAAGVLASSSLYIYLTHFQVYPFLRDDLPVLALLASLAIGIGYARVATRVVRRL
ncbi:AMP-binding protein [Streptomyces sp. MB09-02B]|uniref:AMP-binding protein n=1 Tax=Streptomyces sp. MB09-02B TaxID=3028667 RepID=UPI0029B110F3|nr:AMP-binding protein [Streptomyces sp. MB09-02B]MDX3643190.1 AMP-binding protein [Streptomyces sp. MB09-02B]